MYDETVKRLRYCSEERNGCGLCALSSDCVLRVGLLTQAADAIEELFGKVEQLPRWIPVTERLPEKDCHVLAYYGFDHEGHLGLMFMQVLDYYARDPKPHFQHEGVHGMTVTHWMPLPEPPKEEKQ